MKRILLALALLALVLPGTATAYTPLTDGDGDEIEPDPFITGNVTVANHKIDCGDDVLCFYDDSDDASNLADYGLYLDSDQVDEPIQFTPAKVDVQYYAEDADHKSVTSAWGGNVSNKAWLDVANWAEGSVEGSGNEVLELVVRNGAHALHVKNTGASSPDTDVWTFDFTDITSEVAKTRLILGLEVVSNGVASGNTGYISVYDGDLSARNDFSFGSDTTKKADGVTDPWLANTTGTVFWDELVTEGQAVSGGVSGDIGKVTLTLIADSDVAATEIYIYALGLDVKRYSFGLDDAGEQVYNMTYTNCEGVARSTPLGYTCLAEYAPSFDYETVKDLKLAYRVDASTLPEDNVEILAGENADDAFPWMTNYEFTFELPKQLDLTWAGDEALRYELPVGGVQHDALTVAGTDKVKEVTKKKVGDEVSLSTSLANKEVEVEYTILFTDAQMLHTTETKVLGIFDEDSWFGKGWIWLAGLAGVGLLFARGVKRQRKGSK